jgi:cytoplasmic iron level regulating protein YaaA (DUF328/UPF0246 family)
MKIILSPAKRTKCDSEAIQPTTQPLLIEKTKEIVAWLQRQSLKDLKKLWRCSDKIAQQNYERVRNMDLKNRLTPAICAYEGIAYQYMAPTVFDKKQLEYVTNHLRILSGFYGVLRPMDGVVPHRLDMQDKVRMEGYKNLYDFWGSLLYEHVRDASGVIINLASKEYSQCIEKYCSEQDRYISVNFVEKVGDKYVTKATYAKMARGEMVRFMAEHQIENPENIKAFDRLHYRYREDLSSNTIYFFERTPPKKKDEF